MIKIAIVGIDDSHSRMKDTVEQVIWQEMEWNSTTLAPLESDETSDFKELTEKICEWAGQGITVQSALFLPDTESPLFDVRQHGGRFLQRLLAWNEGADHFSNADVLLLLLDVELHDANIPSLCRDGNAASQWQGFETEYRATLPLIPPKNMYAYFLIYFCLRSITRRRVIIRFASTHGVQDQDTKEGDLQRSLINSSNSNVCVLKGRLDLKAISLVSIVRGLRETLTRSVEFVSGMESILDDSETKQLLAGPTGHALYPKETLGNGECKDSLRNYFRRAWGIEDCCQIIGDQPVLALSKHLFHFLTINDRVPTVPSLVIPLLRWLLLRGYSPAEILDVVKRVIDWPSLKSPERSDGNFFRPLVDRDGRKDRFYEVLFGLDGVFQKLLFCDRETDTLRQGERFLLTSIIFPDSGKAIKILFGTKAVSFDDVFRRIYAAQSVEPGDTGKAVRRLIWETGKTDGGGFSPQGLVRLYQKAGLWVFELTEVGS